MAIITISRGSYSKGKEVAEKVAEKLGYRAVSREVILEASQDFKIPQNRLDHAIHDAPSIFERFTYEKQKYVAYVAAEILDRFKGDNVVYHGLAGQFFAQDVPHLLKVRINANLNNRIRELMERDKITWEQASAFLEKDDRDRRNWSQQLYGVNTTDCRLYDVVVTIDKMTIDNAVYLICEAVNQPQLKTTPESQKVIEDLALAAKVKAALIEDYPTCAVTSEVGAVEIAVKASLRMDTRLSDIITEKASKVPGVSSVSVRLRPTSFFT